MPEEDLRPVKRCVCAATSFAELKEAGVRTMADAEAQFGVGLNCGLCRPYIEKMLETGDIAFAVDSD